MLSHRVSASENQANNQKIIQKNQRRRQQKQNWRQPIIAKG
jgi:hypothetical protein